MSRRARIQRLVLWLTATEIRRVLANHQWTCPRCIELRTVVGPVDGCMVADTVADEYRDLIDGEENGCSFCGFVSAEFCGRLLLCRRCRARHVDILGERGLATLADVLAQHGEPPQTGG
jgi:hypothetical protein